MNMVSAADWRNFLFLIFGVLLILILCLALANFIINPHIPHAEGLKEDFGFSEFNYTLENGCKLPCLLSRGLGYGAGSGLTCDWSKCKG